jgi:hypothetical protein
MKLTNEQSRKRRQELRDSACEWDPIGVIPLGCPRDEYDCLLSPLLRLLEQNACNEQIFRFLDDELRNHFGLPLVPTTRDFASRVQAWYDSSWAGSTVQDGLAE